MKLTNKKKEHLIRMNEKYSKTGERVLAFAFKDIKNNFDHEDDLEDGYTFIGITGMVDPPRDDVSEAISK